MDGLTVGLLQDTAAMLALLRQVCESAPVDGLSDCEADRLWWVTAAECALRVGRSPVGYFRFLIQRGRREVPTMRDQDAAIKRLKECEACLT